MRFGITMRVVNAWLTTSALQMRMDGRFHTPLILLCKDSANRVEYKINRVYFYFLAIAQQHVRGAAYLRGAEFCIQQNVLTKHPILMFLPFHAHLIRS